MWRATCGSGAATGIARTPTHSTALCDMLVGRARRLGPGRIVTSGSSGLLGVNVWSIGISHPIPDVAAHIVKPVAVGRETPNRRPAGEAIFRSVVVGELAGPRVRHKLSVRTELVTP
jgi:hypothetical protein